MTYATSGQDYLFLPILTVRTRSHANEIYKSLVAIGKHVIFTWIPSHIGIHGNTVVGREAKNALDDPVSSVRSSLFNK
jgi:ribonuclease HI